MKTCKRENQVNIGRGRWMYLWNDGEITLDTECGGGIALTAKNIENAYHELVKRRRIKPPNGNAGGEIK